MTDTPAEPALDPTKDFNGTEIKAGQVVMLRHDDVVMMTVEYADPTELSDIVSCVWFDVNDQLQRQTFQGKTLIVCEEVPTTDVQDESLN